MGKLTCMQTSYYFCFQRLNAALANKSNLPLIWNPQPGKGEAKIAGKSEKTRTGYLQTSTSNIHVTWLALFLELKLESIFFFVC